MRGVALDDLSWPADQLGDALVCLARESGLETASHPPTGVAPAAGESLDRWIPAAATALGCEAEAVEVTYGDVEQLVRRGAPALIRCGDDGRYLALLRGGRRAVVALDPQRRRRRASVAAIAEAVRRDVDPKIAAEVERVLEEVAVAPRRRDTARRALLAERLGSRGIGQCWMLDASPGGDFWSAARRAGAPGRVAMVLIAHLLQHSVMIASWWVLGLGALRGRLDRGWLVAWALLLLMFAPLRAWESWSIGVAMCRLGALLKRRLLVGSLRLEPDEIRHQGLGQLLGRILGSESLRLLAMTGAHFGLVTLVELALAIPVLVMGAGGWPHALVLVGWVAFALALSRRYLTQRRRWTELRLAMTHDLVEQMVGYRTRLAQQSPEYWHEREDAQLERYVDLSAELDRRIAFIRVVLPRGWLILSLVLLTPAYVSGHASAAQLAVALGGALFAHWALWKLMRGLIDLSDAVVTWEQVAPIFRAAGRPRQTAAADLDVAVRRAETGQILVEAHDLSYRHAGRAEWSIERCSVQIAAGERILLEGASGSGKTTLASLIAGLRVPDSGLLLVQGLDRHSLGEDGWRRRIVAAPQFQENHIVTGTFAFNLMMGLDWPPRDGDLAAAETICRELALDDLLERMPAGVVQMVGESGWQLSHGEKSRLFIGRALIQDPELVVLDESFAALDPDSLRRALRCAISHARTLLVIAHP